MEYKYNTVELYVEREMYATGWLRLANYVIDLLAFYLIMFLTGVVIGLLASVGVDGPIIWLTENASNASTAMLSLFLFLLYYFLFEAFSQRTIGKFITGTKVVMEDGSKPPAGVIAARCLCRLIPFEAFSFISENSRGWHDSIAGSYVVAAKKYDEARILKASVEEIGSKQSYEF